MKDIAKYIDHTNFRDGGKIIFNNHFQSLYTGEKERIVIAFNSSIIEKF